MTENGRFIIIEGTDGSGKTTQLNLLKKWLEREKVKKTFIIDFPQYAEFWGKLVGRFLRGEFGELDEINPYLIQPVYMLDQATKSRECRKKLRQGYFVLSNRYVTSSMAHQTCKFQTEKERGAFLNWLEEAAYRQLKLLKEDLTIVLYVDPKKAQEFSRNSRGRKGNYTFKNDIAEENFKHQIDSASMYKKLCDKFDTWRLVDCTNEDGSIMPIEQIHLKVVKIVQELLDLDDAKDNPSKDQYKIV